jgi:hypothetical protein
MATSQHSRATGRRVRNAAPGVLRKDNRRQAKATNEPALQEMADDLGKNVGVVVVGDIYWDTRNHSFLAKRGGRKDVLRHKWGRAVSIVKLFPKGIGSNRNDKVYRIKESYGWIAGAASPGLASYPQTWRRKI